MPDHVHEFGGASVVAFVLLVSFAIDRFVSGALFLLSYSEKWREICPDPLAAETARERADAERTAKTAYFVLAGICSAIVLAVVGSGILHEVGFAENRRWLDVLLTGLI